MGLTVLGFESDHRGGKGTQIRILQNLFKTLNMPCIAMRGALYREGIQEGTNYRDPNSEKWRNIMHKYPQVDNMTPKAKYQFEKKNIIDLHNEVYSTLQLFKKITENTKTDLIVLLDRTDISNYFWLKKQNTKLSFQDFKNLLKNDLIIPDCTFYLNVPQDILINRITHDTYPNSSRNKERKCTIKQYHTLYDNTIKDSEERGFCIKEIEGGENIETVKKKLHQAIYEFLILQQNKKKDGN